MGLCLSSEERAERSHSQKIDHMIEEDSRRLKRECKLLLLGTKFNIFNIIANNNDNNGHGAIHLISTQRRTNTISYLK